MRRMESRPARNQHDKIETNRRRDPHCLTEMLCARNPRLQIEASRWTSPSAPSELLASENPDGLEREAPAERPDEAERA